MWPLADSKLNLNTSLYNEWRIMKLIIKHSTIFKIKKMMKKIRLYKNYRITRVVSPVTGFPGSAILEYAHKMAIV